jgi:hypothetical protein
MHSSHIAANATTLRSVTFLPTVQVVSYLANDMKIVLLPHIEDKEQPLNASTSVNELFESDKSLVDLVPQYLLRSGQTVESSHFHANETFYLAVQYLDHSTVSSDLTTASALHFPWSRLLKVTQCHDVSTDDSSSPSPGMTTSSNSQHHRSTNSQQAQSSKIYTSLEILFANDSKLIFNFEIIDRGGCRIVHVFVPYWIVMSSFLPLQYQHDTKSSSSSQERNYLNGVDGLAADQAFHSGDYRHQRKSSGDQQDNSHKRELPKSLGKVRGVDGIILGPETPSKNRGPPSPYTAHSRADFLRAQRASNQQLSSLQSSSSTTAAPAPVASRPNSTTNAGRQRLGSTFSFVSVPSVDSNHSNNNNNGHPAHPPVGIVQTLPHPATLMREISDLDTVDQYTLSSAVYPSQPLAQHQQLSGGSLSELGTASASALSRLLVINQCCYTNFDKRTGRVRFKHPQTEWSNFISLDSVGYQFLTIESLPEPAPGSSSNSNNTGNSTAGGDHSSSSLTSNISNAANHLLLGDGHGHPADSPFLKGGEKIFTFAVQIQPLDAPFQRTKAITIVDRFVMVNNLGQTVEVRQVQQDNLFTVHPTDDESPLWWRPGAPQQLQVRLARYGWSWSGRFAIEEEAEIPLRLRNDYDNTIFFVLVVVSKQGAKTIVSFHYGGDKLSPYRLENHTIETFRIKQVGQAQSTALLPYHCCSYAWDEPLLAQKFSVSILRNALQSQDDWMDIGTFSFDLLHDKAAANSSGSSSKKDSAGLVLGRGGSEVVLRTAVDYLDLRLVGQGPTRVLQIVDNRLQQQSALTTSTTSLGFSTFARPSNLPQSRRLQRTGSAGSGAGAAAFHLVLALEQFGLSVVDGSPEELLYLSVSGLSLDFLAEHKRHSIDLSVQRVQVDNQLMHTPYPSLLHPLLPLTDAYHPQQQQRQPSFVRVQLVQDFELDGLLFFPLLRVELAPFDVNLEGTIIAKLIAMASSCLDLFHETVGPFSKYLQSNSSASSSSSVSKRRNDFDVFDGLVFSSYGLGALRYKQSVSALQKLITTLEVLYDDYHASILPKSSVSSSRRFSATGGHRSTQQHSSQYSSQRQYRETLARLAVQQQLLGLSYFYANPRPAGSASQATAAQAAAKAGGRSRAGGRRSSVGSTASTTATAGNASAVNEAPTGPIGKKIYFERLFISELRLNLSFNPIVEAAHSASGGLADEMLATSSTSNSHLLVAAVSSILVAIGSTVAKIENAPLKFYAYGLEDVFLSGRALGNQMAKNYALQAVKQSYLILFSSQLLGNPVQLVQLLAEGLWDFVHQPAMGLLMKSPEEFLLGVLRGSKSLVRTVIASFCTSAAHMTSSLQVGLIALGVVDGVVVRNNVAATSSAVSSTAPAASLLTTSTSSSALVDPAVASFKDSGALTVLASSTAVATASSQSSLANWAVSQNLRPTNLINGLVYALYGLALDPFRGYRTDGFRGLFVGLAKGTFGLLGRPLFGLLESGSLLLEKVSFWLLPHFLAHQKARLTRSRPPRFFRSAALPLQIYSPHENAGQEILSRLEAGYYRGELYLFHTQAATGLAVTASMVNIPATIAANPAAYAGRETLLLTGRWLFLLANDLEASSIAWRLPLADLVSLEAEYSTAAKRVPSGQNLPRSAQRALELIDPAAAASSKKQKKGVAGPGDLSAFQSPLIGQPVLTLFFQPSSAASQPIPSSPHRAAATTSSSSFSQNDGPAANKTPRRR